MSPRPQAESPYPRGPDGSWIGMLLLLALPTQAGWTGRALLGLMLTAARWRHPAGTDTRCFMSSGTKQEFVGSSW